MAGEAFIGRSLEEGTSFLLGEGLSRVGGEVMEHGLPHVARHLGLDYFEEEEHQRELRDKKRGRHKDSVFDKLKQDFLADLNNKDSPEVEKMLKEAEWAGRIAEPLVGAGYALHGFIKTAGTSKERFSGALESYRLSGKTPGIVGSATSAVIAGVRGKNNEQRMRGLSLFLAESVSEVIGEKVGRAAYNIALPRVSQKLATGLEIGLRNIVGTGISFATIPFFSYGLGKIGRAMDFAYEQTVHPDPQEEKPAQNHFSPMIPDNNESTLSSATKPMPSKSRAHSNLKVSDQRMSRRDIDDAIARRIEHGRAF